MRPVHTRVCVLQLVLETGEGWAQRLGELKEDLVKHKNGLLSKVGARRVEDGQNVRCKIPRQIRSADVGKAARRERGVRMGVRRTGEGTVFRRTHESGGIPVQGDAGLVLVRYSESLEGKRQRCFKR